MAVGDIGMSIDDFCRCTPAGFRAVADAFLLARERKERLAWERTRWQCVCMLQPFISSRIDPMETFRFPWEEEGKQDGGLTTKEIWAKFDAVKKEQGL